MNVISRNVPLAYVAGADSLLGRNLVKRLLEKGIQVIESESEDEVKQLPRLDYAFFVYPVEKADKTYLQKLELFLKISETFRPASPASGVASPLPSLGGPRVVLVSSISLYDLEDKSWDQIRDAETLFLEFTAQKNINARIVRLDSIFGPGMDLTQGDALTRLIWSVAERKLAGNTTPLDFSTRAIFVDDAVDLLIKAVMHGATSQKIYDGVRRNPIKLSEIKQVLADPLWFENSGFKPTILPEWPTPNLERTEKELLWKPQTDLIKSLRITTKDLTQKNGKEILTENPELPKARLHHKRVTPKEIFSYLLSKSSVLPVAGGCLLIFFSFFWPLIFIGGQVTAAKNDLDQGIEALKQGDLEEATVLTDSSQKRINLAITQANSWIVLGEIGLFNPIWREGSQWGQIVGEATTGINKALNGTRSLALAWQVLTEQANGDRQELLRAAREQLRLGESQLNTSFGKLSARSQNNPPIINEWAQTLTEQVGELREVATFEGKITDILLRLGEIPGRQAFLLILQDNTTLTPSGGKPVGAVEIIFEEGILREVVPATLSWYTPGFLSEPDFPATALGIKILYRAETGREVDGVLAVDMTALSEVISVLDKNLTGLLSRVVADGNGNQVAAASLKQLTDGISLPRSLNTLNLSKAISLLLREKHILAYATDRQLMAYFNANGWTGGLSKPKIENRGERTNFLALSEENLGAAHTNYYLQRSIRLKSNLDDQGMVSSRLTVSYRNLSPNVVWPGGSVNSQIKYYLPLNNRLGKVYWGEDEITSQVKSFTDYGRAGYFLTVNLEPGEEKNLVIEYGSIQMVDFQEDKLKINLEVVKQPGTGNDPFEFVLAYPEELKLISQDNHPVLGQEAVFTTDLDTNQYLSWTLQKGL